MNTTLKYALAFVFIVAVFSCTKEKNSAISYKFSFLETGTGGLHVMFSSNAPAGSTFLWNFGDGTTSTESAPIHDYSFAGYYPVVMIINNDRAHADSQEVVIKPIVPPPPPPPPSFLPPAGTFSFHHFDIVYFCDGRQDTVQDYGYVSLSITNIDSVTLSVYSDVLAYSTSNDSTTFYYETIVGVGSNYNSFTYNRRSNTMQYSKSVHVSACANESNLYTYP